MSEALRPEPNLEADITPLAPRPRERNPAEVIDFSKASTEYVTSLFLTELRHPSRQALQGHELAEFIDAEMSGEASGDPTTLRSRLARIVASADVFGNDDLYDHKADHDEVFLTLVEKLQETKSSKELRDQRKAALKLTELRAAIHDDETAEDDTWHDVIDRLFR